ncbi:hypothetical protein FRC03_004818 [Tulasnella sp. 419]|nr:hypothetical protein FRC03_004818 [Tulasnella sp. 419]
MLSGGFHTASNNQLSQDELKYQVKFISDEIDRSMYTNMAFAIISIITMHVTPLKPERTTNARYLAFGAALVAFGGVFFGQKTFTGIAARNIPSLERSRNVVWATSILSGLTLFVTVTLLI